MRFHREEARDRVRRTSLPRPHDSGPGGTVLTTPPRPPPSPRGPRLREPQDRPGTPALLPRGHAAPPAASTGSALLARALLPPLVSPAARLCPCSSSEHGTSGLGHPQERERLLCPWSQQAPEQSWLHTRASFLWLPITHGLRPGG